MHIQTRYCIKPHEVWSCGHWHNFGRVEDTNDSMFSGQMEIFSLAEEIGTDSLDWETIEMF